MIDNKNISQHYNLCCLSFNTRYEEYIHENLSKTNKPVKYYGSQCYQKLFHRKYSSWIFFFGTHIHFWGYNKIGGIGRFLLMFFGVSEKKWQNTNKYHNLTQLHIGRSKCHSKIKGINIHHILFKQKRIKIL